MDPDHSFGVIIYETLNQNKIVASGMCRDILIKVPEVQVNHPLLRARKAILK